MPDHKALTDPEIHEPKGISTSAINTTYVSDGAGSGAWYPTQYYLGAGATSSWTSPYIASVSVTTSYQIVQPVLTQRNANGFTYSSSKLTYTGTPDAFVKMSFNMSLTQASGAAQNYFVALYKNGTIVNDTVIQNSVTSGFWETFPIEYSDIVSTNDYFQMYIKGTTTSTVNIGAYSVHAIGSVKL